MEIRVLSDTIPTVTSKFNELMRGKQLGRDVIIHTSIYVEGSGINRTEILTVRIIVPDNYFTEQREIP